MDEKTLEKYIYSIHKVLDTRYRIVTEAEFKLQIDQLGMTEAELKYIEEQAKYFETQARTLYSFKNWEPAIKAAQKALEIKPYDANLHILIVKIYYRAALATNSTEYLSSASTYCQKGFQLAPDKAFFPKMEEIIKEWQRNNQTVFNYNMYKKAALLAIIAGFFFWPLLPFALIAYFVFKKKHNTTKLKLQQAYKDASFLDLF